MEDYIQKIKEGYECTDHIEIEVLMSVLDRPIIIIESNLLIKNPEVLERTLKGESIFVLYKSDNHYDAFLRDESTPDKDIINFLTQSNNHIRNTV